MALEAIEFSRGNGGGTEFPVLDGGSHVGMLEEITTKQKVNEKYWEGERLHICFKFIVDTETGPAWVFKDVTPSLNDKSNLSAILVGMSGGTGIDFVNDEATLEYLNSQVGKKFMIQVKQYERNDGKKAHCFISLSKLPPALQAIEDSMTVTLDEDEVIF